MDNLANVILAGNIWLPFSILAGTVGAYAIHEWLSHLTNPFDDDDPDGWT